MKSFDGNEIFSKPIKKDITYFINNMRKIKIAQEEEKMRAKKAKPKPVSTVGKEYKKLTKEQKDGLYKTWLRYFPIKRDEYDKYLEELKPIEMNNYLNSKADTEYFQMFQTFGNPGQFSKVFYDDPTSKKGVAYLYRPYIITDKKVLFEIATKKIFQMYVKNAMDWYRLETDKSTELYNLNRIADERDKVRRYSTRKTYSS